MDPTPMRLLHQLVEVAQTAETRVDHAVIAHVITKVLVGTREDGRKPDGFYTQIGQVVKMGDNSGQVAQTVSVGIRKAAEIDLINDTFVPPWEVAHAYSLLERNVVIKNIKSVTILL